VFILFTGKNVRPVIAQGVLQAETDTVPQETGLPEQKNLNLQCQMFAH